MLMEYQNETKPDKMSKLGRTLLQERSNKQSLLSENTITEEKFNRINHQNVLLEKQVVLYADRIKELESCLEVFEDKLKEINGEKETNNELMETMILKNKYKHDSEMKTMQVQALTNEVVMNRKQVELLSLKNMEL